MNIPVANIFETLNIEKLVIEEVREYQEYLQQIVPQLSTPAQKIEVLRLKVRLSQRLVELDFERIRTHNQELEEQFSKNNAW